MKFDVYNQNGEAIDKIELSNRVFGAKMNSDLLHQVITSQLANARQVLAHTKGRGEVRGGGKKPWQQKGTGRARHASIRSPIWKGGGVTFGPTKERNFKKKINRQAKRAGLFMALSSKAKDKQLLILDDIKLSAPKTKEGLGVMNNISRAADGYRTGANKRDSVMIVLPSKDQTIERAFRNLPFSQITVARNLNAYDVLKYKYLFILKDAVKMIETVFK